MLQRDIIIFGGGSAGLWLLDEVRRRGYSAFLLEAGALGSGQTVASQGIIHGGLKYTLQGLLTGSAAAIREMPAIWRECLNGTREPNLDGTRIRSEHCHLWRTDTIASRLGMIGARLGLRVAPTSLSSEDRPTVLTKCPGTVARLDEQVISADSFVATLARRNADHILKINMPDGVRFVTDAPGKIQQLQLTHPKLGGLLKIHANRYLFTAGAGNESLRHAAGLSTPSQQIRPLHMLLVRGRLPMLFGHCVDGAKTRVTITSDADSAGNVVWQVGGQLAENGVNQSDIELIKTGHAELQAVLPGVDFSRSEWATYHANRAEAQTSTGTRPETAQILTDGNTITAWPTKLALVPRLVDDVVTTLPAPDVNRPADADGTRAVLTSWPHPDVAAPPWETPRQWHRMNESERTRKRSA